MDKAPHPAYRHNDKLLDLYQSRAASNPKLNTHAVFDLLDAAHESAKLLLDMKGLADTKEMPALTPEVIQAASSIEIGRKLAELRGSCESQWMADELRIDRFAYSKYENGKLRFPQKHVEKFLQITKAKPEDAAWLRAQYLSKAA